MLSRMGVHVILGCALTSFCVYLVVFLLLKVVDFRK